MTTKVKETTKERRAEQKYNLFKGIYREQMPQLISQGYQPLTIEGIMKRRVQAIKTNEEKDFWLNNYFDTPDGIAYSPNGNILVVRNSDLLRAINQDTRLTKTGALPLDQEQYEELTRSNQGFTRKELEKAGINKWLKPDQVKIHPLLQALSNNQELLDEYTELISREAKEQFNYDEIMGAYVGAYVGDIPKDYNLRAVFLGWLDVRSDAYGGDGLGGDARLVGVSEKKSAEGTLAGKRQIFL